MKKFFIVSGNALLGFLYYYYYGCSQGCAITSPPLNSTIYGAVFGIVVSLDSKKNKK